MSLLSNFFVAFAKNAVIPPKAGLPYLLTSHASNFASMNQTLDSIDKI